MPKDSAAASAGDAHAADRELTEIAVAVVEHQGQYLIGRRRDGVPLAGLWEFPGGKMLPGETPPAAAVRECLEETGLRIVPGTSCDVIEYDYPHARLRLHFVRCQVVDRNSELLPGYRWVPSGELKEYEFPPANGAIIAQLGRA